MDLHGKQIVAGEVAAAGHQPFFGVDPASGQQLQPAFVEATQDDIDRALDAAVAAHRSLRNHTAAARADLLDAIAAGIEGLGEPLLERAAAETGLPGARLVGERGRTCAQLRMFAARVREGSWVEASIDHAIPDRAPIPKPDLRRMLVPIGPVVVFGASNFPLAFSVAGGDSASALAAGCPLVVKGHPNHPGTSEMVGTVVAAAIRAAGFPLGMFSLIQGRETATGAALVTHPATRAVGFTGSLAGGRALFDLAAARPDPIPVYAEMGSTNPVFILPGALAGDAVDALSTAVQTSVTVGVGQFCTNPGILVTMRGDATSAFLDQVATKMGKTPVGTMLHDGIRRNYEAGCSRFGAVQGVQTLVAPAGAAGDGPSHACAALFTTDGATWLSNPTLSEEVFGPSTLVIQCDDGAQMQLVAENLPGQLTATVHGSAAELLSHRELLNSLQDVAGRVIVNSFPTGVEVCASMQHGGPYPATTDVRSTSVGGAAITRFARPLSFQGMPDELLPEELREANPRGILRMVEGEWTRDGGN